MNSCGYDRLLSLISFYRVSVSSKENGRIKTNGWELSNSVNEKLKSTMEGRRQCERTCVYTRIGTCRGTGTNVTAAEFIRDELREFCDLQCATSSLQLFIIDTGQAKRRRIFISVLKLLEN